MIQSALRGSFTNVAPNSEHTLSALYHTQSALYHRKMTLAMYVFAFFAALRVGELTYRPNQSHRNLILFNQITFMETREGSNIETLQAQWYFKTCGYLSLQTAPCFSCFIVASIFESTRQFPWPSFLLAQCFPYLSHIFYISTHCTVQLLLVAILMFLSRSLIVSGLVQPHLQQQRACTMPR